MPVIDQLEKATDTIFDFAETTNERAHEATKNLVTKAQDVEVPFADRLPKLELPLIDRLPEPVEAVDAYFGLCLLYTSPSPRDRQKSRMPSSA